MSIRLLYILLVVGIGLIVWAAIAIYLRVRRHLRASEHGRREMQQEPPQPGAMRKDL